MGNVAALDVAFSPDDRWLLTAGPTVVAWDLASGMRHPAGDPRAPANPGSSIVVDQNGRTPYFLSFSGDGRWLAESSGLRSVTPSDAGQQFAVADRLGFSSNPIVAISADAGLVATGAGDEFAIWQADFARKEFHQVGRIRPDRTAERRTIVAVAPTGKWLVSGADRLERWDLAAGAEWLRLQHNTGVLDVAVSPNARFVATTTVDGAVHVWDTNTWREIFKDDVHRTEGDRATSNTAFSGDGRWLVATSQNVVKLFSTNDWRQAIATQQKTPVDGATFSPDSKWLVLLENRSQELTVVSVSSLQTSHVAHGARVGAVSISPDGSQLLTSHSPYCQRAVQIPGLARVWQISSGQRQQDIPLTDSSLPCQPAGGEKQDGTLDAANRANNRQDWKPIPLRVEAPSKLASPDGAWIATHGFTSNSIELRASNAGDRPGISHRAGGVNSMAMSPDGRWFVTTSGDGGARIWALDRETMILQSCARLTHDLSRDEWRGHLGGESYSAVCPGLPPR